MSVSMRFSLSRRAGVTGLTALVLSGWAGALLAQGLESHDSNAPVDYAADRIDVQDKAKRVLLTGNVEITQKGLKLRAARTLVAYTDNGASGGNDVKIQRIDATGNVEVIRGEEHVWGDLATYDFGRRVITVVGHVRLQNARGNGTGERLVIDLDNHMSNFQGTGSGKGAGSGGRVTGSFSVAKKNAVNSAQDQN
ncbi:LptA/OstA family protein [Novosphingobium humi]|uniref:LptA/OstA family protein n=1 Tax=Novosphingobium humi TaxID=2282397 RepID=UPI0025AEF8C6|nr:LptA/OstA family protein [Novosphingobium humi]WJS99234.1 OstA family protein [Novosphingobium humi]